MISRLPSDELVDRMSIELEHASPLILHVDPVSTLQLVGLVQMAMRHPAIPQSTRELGASIVQGAAKHFREFPALIEMIRRGYDPAHDAPPAGEEPLSQPKDEHPVHVDLSIEEVAVICLALGYFTLAPAPLPSVPLRKILGIVRKLDDARARQGFL